MSYVKCKHCENSISEVWRSVEADKLWRQAHPGNDAVKPDLGELLSWLMKRADRAEAENKALREALIRAERKLRAYVGVCKGDKELTDTVLPMCDRALAL